MYLHVIKCVLSVPAVVGHRFMSLYTRPDGWEPLDYAGGGPVKKVNNPVTPKRATSQGAIESVKLESYRYITCKYCTPRGSLKRPEPVECDRVVATEASAGRIFTRALCTSGPSRQLLSPVGTHFGTSRCRATLWTPVPLDAACGTARPWRLYGYQHTCRFHVPVKTR